MTSNVSKLDRIIRVIIAIVAAVVAVSVGASTTTGIVLFVVAAIMLGTSAISFCPLYRIFGLSTKK
jgi:uncharacterized membrane protein